jgi:hypothetical protein
MIIIVLFGSFGAKIACACRLAFRRDLQLRKAQEQPKTGPGRRTGTVTNLPSISSDTNPPFPRSQIVSISPLSLRKVDSRRFGHANLIATATDEVTVEHTMRLWQLLIFAALFSAQTICQADPCTIAYLFVSFYSFSSDA